jgi:hypothetical protein
MLGLGVPTSLPPAPGSGTTPGEGGGDAGSEPVSVGGAGIPGSAGGLVPVAGDGAMLGPSPWLGSGEAGEPIPPDVTAPMGESEPEGSPGEVMTGCS